MTSVRAYVDANVTVMMLTMTLAGDPEARGVREVRGSIQAEALVGT